MELVINKCYGGFGLSIKAQKLYAKKSGNDDCGSGRGLERDDPILVEVVRELGKEADGDYADLKIVEIPDGIDYAIEEYDGNEWVAESHSTWG